MVEIGTVASARALSELGPTADVLRELKRRLDSLLGSSLISMPLFGSRARGDWHEGSDVDVAIIVRGMDRTLKSRVLDVVVAVELESLTPLSALVMSEERYAELWRRERRIALDIHAEGIHCDPGKPAGQLLAKLMKYREEADYDPAHVFTAEDFQELRAETEAVAEAARSYLAAQGFS